MSVGLLGQQYTINQVVAVVVEDVGGEEDMTSDERMIF